jgi:methionyl-tRNA formyltransferase
MIYRARVISYQSDAAAGSIVRMGANPIVRCGEDALELLEVQAPGRKRMRAGDWARGRRVAVGDQLGA